MSVCTAALSLLISSFLTRHYAGLLIFHGLVFGCSCGLGYMVRPNANDFQLLAEGRVRTPYQVSISCARGDFRPASPHVVQVLVEPPWHW